MGIEMVHWLGHASFRLDGRSACVYIDPWKLRQGARGADLVLVTHEHFDHCSPGDVALVAGPHTVVVAPEPCRRALEAVCGSEALRIVAPGQETNECGVGIRALPAYNTRADRQGFHPLDPALVRLGYLVTLDGTTVYHAGDTDAIPEMEGLEPDVALLPVGGKYTMNSDEAAEAARLLGAGLVVPMHWGEIVGSRSDALRLVALAGTRARLIERE